MFTTSIVLPLYVLYMYVLVSFIIFQCHHLKSYKRILLIIIQQIICPEDMSILLCISPILEETRYNNIIQWYFYINAS